MREEVTYPSSDALGVTNHCLDVGTPGRNNDTNEGRSLPGQQVRKIVVETMRIELTTSALRTRRSPS